MTIRGTLEPVGDDHAEAPFAGYRVELLFKRRIEVASGDGSPRAGGSVV